MIHTETVGQIAAVMLQYGTPEQQLEALRYCGTPVSGKAIRRPSCHNRDTLAAGYYAPDREYFPDGRFRVGLKWIPHTMTTECQSAKFDRYAECAGCKELPPEEPRAAAN